MVLLPDNLFYNTSAAGIIVVLSKRKPEDRKGKIVLLNASCRVGKGRPKNYIPEDDIRPFGGSLPQVASPWTARSPSSAASRRKQADYNLSPSRWIGQVCRR